MFSQTGARDNLRKYNVMESFTIDPRSRSFHRFHLGNAASAGLARQWPVRKKVGIAYVEGEGD
jgi:hypothetical protein